MKKVLHILYSGLGGHGSVFFSLVKADKRHQFSAEAVFCGVETVRADYITQCGQLQIPYTAIKKKPGFDPLVYIRLYKALRKARPSVLFLHGASFIIPAAAYKFFNRSVKLIIRDTQAHHLKTKRDWLLLKKAIGVADHLVFLTNEAKDGVFEKTHDKRLERKAVIIPNGLDTDLYLPVPERDLNKEVVIGMQSRLQRIKDHATLLKAFALLCEQLPNRKLRLRVAGDGETSAELEQLSVQLGISSQVEFCGMLNEKDLLVFMQTLDIYVHATFGETMSNSIMQAMACGLPVIASNVWGVNNMVTDGENGILYTSKNELELCQYLSSLISNDQLRRQLATRARQYAEKEFSLTELFKKYSQLF